MLHPVDRRRAKTLASTLGSAWLFHAGVIGIVLWVPVLSLLQENHHSLQISIAAQALVTAIFFALPVTALALAEFMAARRQAANRDRLRRFVATLGVLLLLCSLVTHFPRAQVYLSEFVVVGFAALTGIWYLRAPPGGRKRRLAEVLSVALVIALFALLNPIMLEILALMLAGVLVERTLRLVWSLFVSLAGYAGVLVSILCAWSFVSPLSASGAPSGAQDFRSASEGRGVDQGPVFLLVFDGLSRKALTDDAGTVNPRFSGLSALAAEGFSLASATTNYDHTRSSVPSMLLGKRGFRPPLAGEPNLFQLVGSRFRVDLRGVVLDYCGAFARYVSRCQDSRNYFTVGRGSTLINLVWDLYLETTLPSRFSRPTEQFRGHDDWKEMTRLLATDLVRDVQLVDLPSRFFFAHLFSPHTPFVLEGDGRIHQRPGTQQSFHEATTRDDLATAHANYLHEIDFIDGVVTELSSALKRRGWWERATIIITADHGYCWEWTCRNWGQPGTHFVTDMVANVPFIVKLPSGFSRPVLNPQYQHVDLIPTILELSGIAPSQSPALEGRSIFSAAPSAHPIEVRSTDDKPWRYNEALKKWVPSELSPELESRSPDMTTQ